MSSNFAWRIDEKPWAERCLRGEGAARFGGRWNSRGIKVVYASEHLAMAVLEKYVNLHQPLPGFVEFSHSHFALGALSIREISFKELPPGWDSLIQEKATQSIGDQWVRSQETAILKVPSAVLEEESNFILNPSHPDFAAIKITTSANFNFPGRLLHLAPA